MKLSAIDEIEMYVKYNVERDKHKSLITSLCMRYKQIPIF